MVEVWSIAINGCLFLWKSKIGWIGLFFRGKIRYQDKWENIKLKTRSEIKSVATDKMYMTRIIPPHEPINIEKPLLSTQAVKYITCVAKMERDAVLFWKNSETVIVINLCSNPWQSSILWLFTDYCNIIDSKICKKLREMKFFEIFFVITLVIFLYLLEIF